METRENAVLTLIPDVSGKVNMTNILKKQMGWPLWVSLMIMMRLLKKRYISKQHIPLGYGKKSDEPISLV